MMFILREIAVSLAFFVLLYCCLSIFVVATWRGLNSLRVSEKSLAETLFTVRILPMIASVIITSAFVVPSFQLLEPRWTDEGMGRLPVALGVAAIFLIAFGCYRVIAAQGRTSRVVAQWLGGARTLDRDALTVRSRRDAPPLTLVGVRKPRVLASELTLELLTESEIRIALQHERAHIRSWDNLKKLIFRFCPFPGLDKLEAAWAEAAELAADDSAVSSANDAVDLAAALVKLSRIVPVEAPPMCMVGFVTGSISRRVARLLAWNETKEQRLRIPGWAAIGVLFGTGIAAFVTYGPALVITHEITELLVRSFVSPS
jgi:Zn-dependent protease with chaperone function